MLSAKESARYSRQIILPEVGVQGQQKLKEASVLVIGAGGLGCPVLQYLAAAGVGNIGIADGDVVEQSNLQRQLLYRENEIGQSKASVAAEKIKVINPLIKVDVHQTNIKVDNAETIISGYDIVVDGTDNFSSRYLINDTCVILNKPLVFGSIFKFEGQVSVFNYKGGPTYRCVFPEPPEEEEMPNCATIGVIATLPGIVGTLQANEVIKLITGIGEALNGRLLVIDALTMNMQTFAFNAVEANKNIKELKQKSYVCATNVEYATYDDLQKLEQTGTILIDVREKKEHDAFNIGGINVPLKEIEAMYTELETDKSILLYCASGVRSKKAAEYLAEKGFTKVRSLKEGINQLKVS
jgi:molybdopterin/thiamine biosynthesis adenylyltransferase/rhodanese-related sulfurtransferase